MTEKDRKNKLPQNKQKNLKMRQYMVEILRISSFSWSFSTAVC